MFTNAELWEQSDLYDEWNDAGDEEFQNEYPEGFKWTCCGKAHDDPGCVVDKHDPTDGHGTKRMRGSPYSEPDNVVNLVSDEEEDDDEEEDLEEEANPFILNWLHELRG